jgi:hypothetical protein
MIDPLKQSIGDDMFHSLRLGMHLRPIKAEHFDQKLF